MYTVHASNHNQETKSHIINAFRITSQSQPQRRTVELPYQGKPRTLAYRRVTPQADPGRPCTVKSPNKANPGHPRTVESPHKVDPGHPRIVESSHKTTPDAILSTRINT